MPKTYIPFENKKENKSELTIKDEFAIAALVGLVPLKTHMTDEVIAAWAYDIAEAMVKERAKEKRKSNV
jgi:hypothetical protein